MKQERVKFSQARFLKNVLIGLLFIVVAFLLGLVSSFFEELIAFRFRDIFLFVHTMTYIKMIKKWNKQLDLVAIFLLAIALLLHSVIVFALPDFLSIANQNHQLAVVFDLSLYTEYALSFFNPVHWVMYFSVGYILQLFIVFACVFLLFIFTFPKTVSPIVKNQKNQKYKGD